MGWSHFSHTVMPESQMITLYGIPNCDTVRKARAWLAERGKNHEFHDFKKDGVPPKELARWADALSWEALLNRKGTTWRKLAAEVQLAVHDSASAQALMQVQSSVIKRPVVDWGDGKLTVGFDPQSWDKRV
jgi:arsenate reductase (glutaredoxin)